MSFWLFLSTPLSYRRTLSGSVSGSGSSYSGSSSHSRSRSSSASVSHSRTGSHKSRCRLMKTLHVQLVLCTPRAQINKLLVERERWSVVCVHGAGPCRWAVCLRCHLPPPAAAQCAVLILMICTPTWPAPFLQLAPVHPLQVKHARKEDFPEKGMPIKTEVVDWRTCTQWMM